MNRRQSIFSLGVLALALGGSVVWWTEKPAAADYPYFEGTPPRYVNDSFGLEVVAPPDLHLCPADDAVTTSHGVWIPLGKGDACPKILRTLSEYPSPFISIYVEFEVAYDATSVDELADAKCATSKISPSEMPDLRIPGHEPALCKDVYLEPDAAGKMKAGNRINTEVLALAGTPEDGSSVELIVSLVTTGDPQPVDLENLKRVLQGVKWKPKAP